jgi:hypothetical protein
VSAQIVHFPSEAPPPTLLATRARLNPYVFPFRHVALQLGINDKAPTYQVAYVRALIQYQNFPFPLPHVVVSRGLTVTGVDAVRPGASWQKAAVDAWFDGLLPPGARTTDAAASAAADTLDANAGNINDLLARHGA